MKDEKALNSRLGSERVDTVVRPRRCRQHVRPLGAGARDVELRQILFTVQLAWLEGTVLCVARVHPDLGSDQNTLNQLGPNEGHFAPSFILYIREMPASPRMANRGKRPEQHNTQ